MRPVACSNPHLTGRVGYLLLVQNEVVSSPPVWRATIFLVRGEWRPPEGPRISRSIGDGTTMPLGNILSYSRDPHVTIAGDEAPGKEPLLRV